MEPSTDFLYCSIEEAVSELKRRRRDGDFCQFVSSLFGSIPLPLAEDRLWAVLARYVASPTLEFTLFHQMANDYDLNPLVFEFTADKLVAKNAEKYALCNMSFAQYGDRGYIKTSGRNIINFNQDEGKPLNQIMTISGESLVDFHHRILRGYLGNGGVDVYDFSHWFVPTRGIDRWTYYLRYLGLFLCNGILFENFLMDKREAEFTKEVVFPAFRTITDVAGCKPLIVRAIPKEHENEPWWCYYSETITHLL